MRVSPIGGTAYTDLLCLEDTGSSNFTLFETDLYAIGVSPGYTFWMPDVSVQVVGGALSLQCVILELQVLSHGVGSEAVGGVFYDTCHVLPGGPDNQLRLSGMGLHRHLFVATAPNGLGVQYVATNKTRLAAQLPVVQA